MDLVDGDGDEPGAVAASLLRAYDDALARLSPAAAVEACVLCLAGLEARLRAHNQALTAAGAGDDVRLGPDDLDGPDGVRAAPAV